MGDNRITGIGTNGMMQGAGVDVVKRQEEAAEVMFADMISMNASADNFATGTADDMFGAVEGSGSSKRNEKPADAYDKYQYKDKAIRTETSNSKPHKAEEAVAEVKEFEKAVAEVIEEELHVSKEELEAAMEELGLTYLDLLDKGNLANLTAKLTGSENMNQLLCNEAFTNVMQQMDVLGTELLNEVQMTPEELMECQKAFEQQIDIAVQETEGLDTDQMVQEAADDVADDLQSLHNAEQPEAVDTESVEMTEDGIKPEIIHVDAAEGKQTDSSEEELSEGEQNLAGNSGKQVSAQVKAQPDENVAVTQPQNNTFTEQLDGVETVQQLPPNVTVSDIMEQIAEHTRVMISADTTKMEMQLNPENLGKLYVEVTENEGSVTAKFQTQNAVVKEALEMQIADLKMNLSQAGVKVDSVEVTIASHEFERNLEQDANGQKQQENEASKSAGRRNINLNSLEGLSGLMTEEETLVAKMMAEQGNSVNFTA